LSSTTDRRRGDRGQIVVIFAGGLILMLAMAALVFDVGQNLLDRRTQQNVSDAAALAGARYVVGATYSYHGGCASAPLTMPAVNAACDVAVESGYVDGVNSRTVRVDLPPIAPSPFSNLPGHIEVSIGSTRPSFFAGVLGLANQRVAAMGVATNASDIALPYSLLALDPHGCGTNKINGAPGTIVTTTGTVHVDSDCPTDAILLSGNGVLTAPECDVVGRIKTSGGAVNNCTEAPAGVLLSGDPLKNLPAPPKPGFPLAVQPLNGGPIPSGCPGGSSPATEAVPRSCAFTSGPMNGKIYRIFPGYYPGGIETSRATVYMDPGVYWIGGGGISVKSVGGQNGLLISKTSGDNTGTNPTGGVLIYNSVPLSGTGYGQISLNGGAGATLALHPIQSGLYKGMVIFVDRVAAFGGVDDIDLNGGGSTLEVIGTIYAPTGTVKFNGSSTDVISAQIICYNFQVNGSGASFTLDYNPDNLFHLKGVGLVE
jgi:Putative Flp pilus-assembly TadE/G-like